MEYEVEKPQKERRRRRAAQDNQGQTDRLLAGRPTDLTQLFAGLLKITDHGVLALAAFTRRCITLRDNPPLWLVSFGLLRVGLFFVSYHGCHLLIGSHRQDTA